jgi:hypothetical protein
MSDNGKKTNREKRTILDVTIEKWKTVGVIVAAIFSAIGVIATAYFSYLAILTPTRVEATRTAEAKLTLTPSIAATATETPFNKLILSKHAEFFDFDDGKTSGWRPFAWDTGWVVYEKSGDIEVVGKAFVLDDHPGPFLKYPLDLESEEHYAYLKRNAIYKPVDGKVIGIIANVCYESEDAYSLEEIYAGFVIPYRVGEKELSNEDYVKKLIPNRWNTIVWSLYSPVWWGREEMSEKWSEFIELFGDEGANMWPGRRLDHVKIDKIGIQFFVHTEGGPRQFKGTAYIDNIALIYQHLP